MSNGKDSRTSASLIKTKLWLTEVSVPPKPKNVHIDLLELLTCLNSP